MNKKIVVYLKDGAKMLDFAQEMKSNKQVDRIKFRFNE